MLKRFPTAAKTGGGLSKEFQAMRFVVNGDTVIIHNHVRLGNMAIFISLYITIWQINANDIQYNKKTS